VPCGCCVEHDNREMHVLHIPAGREKRGMRTRMSGTTSDRLHQNREAQCFVDPREGRRNFGEQGPKLASHDIQLVFVNAI